MKGFGLNELLLQDRICDVEIFYVGKTTKELTKNKSYPAIYINKHPDKSYIILENDKGHLCRIRLNEEKANLFVTKKKMRKLKLAQLKESD